MTTDEFKREIEKLGLVVKASVFPEVLYNIEDEDNEYYAWVSCERECVLDVNGKRFEEPKKQRKLLKIVTEYATTPIEEREPKRFFKYKLKLIAKKFNTRTKYLTYDKVANFFDLQGETRVFQTVFKENDPVLNDVNLEMFDAIEVDADGNEI